MAHNTPPDALIAAHDIGAVGYFGQRRLLDLAGLVSPEVIPFIRDEAQHCRAGWTSSRPITWWSFPAGMRSLPAGKTHGVSIERAVLFSRAGGTIMEVYRGGLEDEYMSGIDYQIYKIQKECCL